MKRIVLVLMGVLLAGCGAISPVTPSSYESFTEAPATATLLPTQTATVLNPETPTALPSAMPPTAPVPSATPQQVRFAVLGDYGMDGAAEADVAKLIHGWAPDFILTTGDNNNPTGSADTIDANIGKYFHDYIFPYAGVYGSGATVNRFFPTLGNHDWYTHNAQPYLDYFTLPGNERYYDFVQGPVHFFALDSDFNEPDGVGSRTVQAAWLRQALAASTSRWNIVYMHHPPFSSGEHGSIEWMQWPFAAWGADALLAGNEHLYERLLVDGIPYITIGTGGDGLYDFLNILPESQFRYNANYGAMLVTANATEMLFEFHSRTEELIDSFRLTKP